MKWTIIENSNVSNEEILHIAELKNQHWPYGIDSQIQWMKENIHDDDVHLLGEIEFEKKRLLIAYITLSNVLVSMDGMDFIAIGVGGVCVSKKYQYNGIGTRLVIEANKYISDRKLPGILLCKDNLVKFYNRCNWQVLNYQEAMVDNNIFRHNIMFLDCMKSCVAIAIDRNF